jgi:quercetin dioxygenase-like cupin family protein
MRMKRSMWLAFGVCATAVAASAQSNKDQLRVLERTDLSVAGREAISAVDRMRPFSATGWHTHPGEMVGYVTHGEVVVEREGIVAQPLRAGQSFVIPAGLAHNSRNIGTTAAEMFVVFIVEKNRPMSSRFLSQDRLP